jgi:hypothetical protein
VPDSAQSRHRRRAPRQAIGALTATVTATAPANGKRQRSAAHANTRTSPGDLGIRPAANGRGSRPFRRDCCQYCCQAAGQHQFRVDSCGMSGQRTNRSGRLWTMRLFLRISRLGVRVPPSAHLRARPGQRPLCPPGAGAFVLTDLLTKDSTPAGKTGIEQRATGQRSSRCQEAMLVAGRSARRWCPMSNKSVAAPLSSSIA